MTKHDKMPADPYAPRPDIKGNPNRFRSPRSDLAAIEADMLKEPEKYWRELGLPRPPGVK